MLRESPDEWEHGSTTFRHTLLFRQSVYPSTLWAPWGKHWVHPCFYSFVPRLWWQNACSCAISVGRTHQTHFWSCFLMSTWARAAIQNRSQSAKAHFIAPWNGISKPTVFNSTHFLSLLCNNGPHFCPTFSWNRYVTLTTSEPEASRCQSPKPGETLC